MRLRELQEKHHTEKELERVQAETQKILRKERDAPKSLLEKWNALKPKWFWYLNNPPKFNEVTSEKEFFQDLTNLLTALGGKKGRRLYDSVQAEMFASYKINETRFFVFAQYFKENLQNKYFHKGYSILKEFFDLHDDFNQVRSYATYSEPVESGFSPSSIDFDKIKMYYGNAYEVLSDGIEVFAFLNNLISGRRFDEFKKTTFSTFQKLPKAQRADQFQHNKNFTVVSDILDNNLRNATHHLNAYFDIDTGIISWTDKDDNKHEISYVEYLLKCYEITISITVLFELLVFLSYLIPRLLEKHKYQSNLFIPLARTFPLLT